MIAPLVYCYSYHSVQFGFELLQSLIYFVLIVLIGLSIQQFVVSHLLITMFRRSPLKFFMNAGMFFCMPSTASSNATLLALIRQKPPETAAPHLPFCADSGAAANQNGTALFGRSHSIISGTGVRSGINSWSSFESGADVHSGWYRNRWCSRGSCQ